jgi:hypothetical protein
MVRRTLSPPPKKGFYTMLNDHEPLAYPLRRLEERTIDICDHLAEHLAEMELLVQAGELDSPGFRAELASVRALEAEQRAVRERYEYIERLGV